MDILSTNDASFLNLVEDEATSFVGVVAVIRDRPRRDPVFSVETLMEGRGAYAAVFEDATPFLRR